MSDFGTILKRGKKLFVTKDKRGVFGRCEECNSRAKLYDYLDNEKQSWKLCEQCIQTFTKDEEEEK